MMQSRRMEREARARQTTGRAIPDILRGSPRAKHGISQAELILDPQARIKSAASHADAVQRTDLTIRIESADPLQLASRSSHKPYISRAGINTHPSVEQNLRNVAVHNMASMTRPGAGFLSGKNGQEEFLCVRTTLFASLDHEFYPLPDLGGIYTPDVLVFRDVNGIDIPKRDRFFIDIISAGVSQHMDGESRYDGEESACSCGVSYCDRDRDLITRKMKAVMRMAEVKGNKKLILGAWGCGLLNHPVREVAKLWRKVISGSERQRRPNVEQWEGIDEVIFSIPNPAHAREFREVFDDILAPDLIDDTSDVTSPGVDAEIDQSMARLIASAKSLELQIEQARNTFLKNQLQEDLMVVNHEMTHGRAVKARRDEAYRGDEDVEDGFVVDGYPGSDGEENTFFRIDGTASESEAEVPKGDSYEFRLDGRGGYDSQASQDEDECLDENSWVGYSPSPQFDPQTGWFQGSIDELSAHLHSNGKTRSGSISPRSPLVRRESNAAYGMCGVVDGFFARFQRNE